ncbi:VWD domain-containing protein [Micromonospora sp. M12]
MARERRAGAAGGGAGFTEDQCATLIHEMNHALDEVNDTDRGQFCTQEASSPVGGPGRGARGAGGERVPQGRGVPTRTTYSGQKLPSNGKDCDKPRPRPPGGGGCSISVIGKGYRCGNSNGDPHLLSYDGLRYDFQAAGEFVLTRSTRDDFEVQTRQTMFPASSVVAVNSAVAARVAGDRVGVYATPDGPVIRVNGARRCPRPTGEAAARRHRHQLVRRHGDSPVAGRRAADRTADRGVGLSVSVSAPTGRAGTLEGLLGDHDGDPADDLTVRGGKRRRSRRRSRRCTPASPTVGGSRAAVAVRLRTGSGHRHVHRPALPGSAPHRRGPAQPGHRRTHLPAGRRHRSADPRRLRARRRPHRSGGVRPGRLPGAARPPHRR